MALRRKKMMADLEDQIKDTEKAISDMNKAGADPKAIQAKRKQLGEYKKQLNELQSATEGVNRALDNLDKATPRELERSLRTLNKQLKDMTPGTEVWQSTSIKSRNSRNASPKSRQRFRSKNRYGNGSLLGWLAHGRPLNSLPTGAASCSMSCSEPWTLLRKW